MLPTITKTTSLFPRQPNMGMESMAQTCLPCNKDIHGMRKQGSRDVGKCDWRREKVVVPLQGDFTALHGACSENSYSFSPLETWAGLNQVCDIMGLSHTNVASRCLSTTVYDHYHNDPCVRGVIIYSKAQGRLITNCLVQPSLKLVIGKAAES